MKTEVIMKRELFGMEISQKSKSEFFSATDLVRAGNKWRVNHDQSLFNISEFLRTKATREYVTELAAKYGKVKINATSQHSHTWVHPLLFIDIALAISPKLKIEVYEWLFDHLIRNRNLSGDSYKEMCGRLYVRQGNKQVFPRFIKEIAKEIKDICEVEDWEHASEEQLKRRDKIHYDIALLADVMSDSEEAVRIAFLRNES